MKTAIWIGLAPAPSPFIPAQEERSLKIKQSDTVMLSHLDIRFSDRQYVMVTLEAGDLISKGTRSAWVLG
jgi:hypothetical protein